MSFVGRAGDLEAIARAFESGAAVVTVVGPGGIGKTTLAKRYLEMHAEERAGAWFCDLTETRAAGDVYAAVARALGVRGAPTSEAAWMDRVGLAVSRRRGALVVLDNCEQAIDGVASALRRWRELAPRAAWVLTSRQLLRITGEHPLELGPLSLPVGRDDGSSSEAVELFVQRATIARPGYAPTPDEADAIAGLVRALEGVPLAIELAAARMGVLDPRELLRRMSTSLDALGRGPRDAPVRQQTLEATVAWSWDLLDEAEKAALAQCAGFQGGFTAEAAEAVVDLSAVGGAPAVLDILQSLRDKSLLRRASGGGPEVRLGFYEVVRDFAAKRLAASGQESAVHARAARFFLAPASRWAESHDTISPEGGFDAASQDDFDNVVAVRDRAMSRLGHDPSAARELLAAAVVLEPLLCRRGSADERLRSLDLVLGAASAASDDRAYRWLLLSLSVLRSRREAHGPSDFDRVWELAVRFADVPLQVRVLNHRALAALHRGEAEQAVSLCQEALARCRESLPNAKTSVLVTLASAQVARGRPDEAIATYTEVLAGARALDRDLRARCIATCNINLGELSQLRGRHDEAMRYFGAAEREATEDPRERFYLRGAVARLEHDRGRLTVARDMYTRALQGMREAGEVFEESRLLAALGALLADADEIDAAERMLAEAETLASTRQEAPALATVAVHRGNLDLARARAAEGRGASDEAARYRAEAERRRQLPAEQATTEVALARRLLARALEVSSAGPRPDKGTDGPLVVSPDCRRAVTPDGRTIDLASQPRMRRLLATLVDARLQTPGRALSVDELFETVWQGERASYEAARGRVYVALTRLRDLGLRDLVLHDLDGYRIDPGVPVVRSTAQGES